MDAALAPPKLAPPGVPAPQAAAPPAPPRVDAAAPGPSAAPGPAPGPARLNVGANEFRPRAAPSVRAPSAPDEPEDEEEDEFSPFARSAAPPAPEAPAVPIPMSPLDVFYGVLLSQNPDVFGGDHPRLTPQSIQEALERKHYDVQATMHALRAQQLDGAPPAPPPEEPASPRRGPALPNARVNVVPRDVFNVAGNENGSGNAGGGAARVCRYFLGGECRRSDCRFSHDLNKALCRFWLRGQCLNDPCAFLHDYDALTSLASGISLSDAPEAPEPEPPPPPPPRTRDPHATRWAAAAARPKHADARQRVARGEAAVALGGARAPQRPAAPSEAAPAPAPRPSAAGLRPPTLVPTLATGTALASEFAKRRAALAKKHKRDADPDAVWATAKALLRARHEQIRETLLVAAGGDAGGWGSSAQASDEPGARGLRGRWIGGGLGLCLGVARPANVAKVSRGAAPSLEERTEALLDLHGLQAGEAVLAVDRFLAALAQERFRGQVYLGVGAGRHAAGGGRGGGKLAAQVREWLTSHGLPYAEYDGMLACGVERR